MRRRRWEWVMAEGFGVPDVRRCRQVHVSMVLGVSVKTVKEWSGQGGCPRNGDGTYDLRAVVAWRVAREQEGGALPELTPEERADPEVVEALLAASSSRERLVFWKAEKARVDYEVACGKLVPREQVAELLSVLAGRLRESGEVLIRSFGEAAGKVLWDVLEGREWGRFGEGIGEGKSSPQRHRGTEERGRDSRKGAVAQREEGRGEEGGKNREEGRGLTTKGTKGTKGTK